uniref:Uncharacterized protein n=1 Tax=Knipowitschia caucasica TaxID=637954 RepID=A0AAV2KSE4_KNICA
MLASLSSVSSAVTSLVSESSLGVRLSDGQRGWFPAENVIEITNEHVRRRNLRERYRVMQAASNFTNTRSRTGN